MSWAEPILPWGPSVAVGVLAILALAVAFLRPAKPLARALWVAGIFLCGSLALAAALLTARAEQKRARETREAWARLAERALADNSLSAAPAQIAERVLARLNGLSEERRMLRSRLSAFQSQLAALEKKMQGRAIAPGQAAALEAYLARSGTHVAVVASLTGDVEAYQYADQIVHVLERAGWQAKGPEATAMFGSAPAMGINLYVPDQGDAEAARILAEGFRKFDVPFATRVMPAGVVPEPGIVQLFISRKP